MVGLLIRMRWSGRWQAGAAARATFIAGTAVSVAAVALTWIVAAHPGTGLGLVLFGWQAAWLASAVFGTVDGGLPPSYVALLPARPRSLAAAALVSSLATPTFGATLLAFIGAGVLRGPGGWSVVDALDGALLALGVALAAGVVSNAIGRTARSRIGIELTAMAIGVGIALLSTGWIVYWSVPVALGSVWSDAVAGVLRWSPTNWGLASVGAFGRGAVVAGWCGQLALSGLAGALVALSLRGRGIPTRLGAHARVREHPSVGRAPLGAVVAKERRVWQRDPLRVRLVRTATWAVVPMCVLPALVHWTVMLPWAGPLVVVLAAGSTANLYGFDHTALWITMVIPNGARTDVRGRQLAWLLTIAPVTLLVGAGLTQMADQPAAWPWVASTLPALLGGGAAVVAAGSVAAAVPLHSPRRRADSPFATGPDTGRVALQMRLAIVAAALPAGPPVVAALVATRAGASPWLAVPIGLATGGLLFWFGGTVAAGRLERRAPELLATLRG